MTVYFPWGLVAIIISLYFFYSANRRNRSIKGNRRERLAKLLEELLESLKNNNQSPEDNKRKKELK